MHGTYKVFDLRRNTLVLKTFCKMIPVFASPTNLLGHFGQDSPQDRHLQVCVFAKCLLHATKPQLSRKVNDWREQLIHTKGLGLYGNSIGHLLN